MAKGAAGFIIGILVVCFLCICCCVVSMIALSGNSDFRDGYCQGYLESSGSLRNEPFGWCK